MAELWHAKPAVCDGCGAAVVFHCCGRFEGRYTVNGREHVCNPSSSGSVS